MKILHSHEFFHLNDKKVILIQITPEIIKTLKFQDYFKLSKQLFFHYLYPF